MKAFLLFLSKTDKNLIKECPRSAVNNQMALGAFVLLTGIFALLSGTYAVSTLFAQYDPDLHRPVVTSVGIVKAFLLGIVYCTMIMAIDREIVAASSKTSILIRLPLAFFVGIIVAVPMEMKLFEGRIDKQLFINFQNDNLPSAQNREQALTDFKTQEAVLNQRLNQARARVIDITDKLDQEETGAKVLGRTGIEGHGPAYRQLRENLILAQQDVQQAQSEVDEFRLKENGVITDAAEAYQRDSIPQAYDFLSRYEVLDQITTASDSANRMSWGISILFIFLEITPALIKLILKPSEYDVLLETRRRLNIQMTHALGNTGMEEMETEIENTNAPDYLKRIKSAMMR